MSRVTYAHQDALPSLPVPPLEQTLRKYLLTVRPLLSDAEYARTVALVRDFEQGDGPRLHRLLEERARNKRNWLAEWWYSLAYYSVRAAVTCNVSFFFVFDRWRANECSQAARAAHITAAALAFKKQLDEETLPPDRAGNKLLDMIAFKWMFNACRHPGEKEDHSQVYANSRHICVAVDGKFFYFDVYDDSNNALPPAALQTLFEQTLALADSLRHVHVPAIGYATSEERTDWFHLRNRFASIGDNKNKLEILESSIFLVCLDRQAPTHPDQLARLVWHGDGVSRYFDKSLQFVVSSNALAGVNGEHSALDGMPVGRLSDFVIAWTPPAVATNAPALPRISLIEFDSNAVLSHRLAHSAVLFDRFVNSFSLRTFRASYGSSLVRGFNISPDAWFQFALQLTHYRIHSQFGVTYESAHTKIFFQGRTETIRACSIDSCNWVLSMCDANATNEQRASLLRKASASHIEYARDASANQGVDRHLLGLRMIAAENNIPLHPLYSDAAFARSRHWKLSTSQLPSPNFNTGFGPDCSYLDSYGVCYNIRPEAIVANITTYAPHVNRDIDIDVFTRGLAQSLHDMKQLFASAKL